MEDLRVHSLGGEFCMITIEQFRIALGCHTPSPATSDLGPSNNCRRESAEERGDAKVGVLNVTKVIRADAREVLTLIEESCRQYAQSP